MIVNAYIEWFGAFIVFALMIATVLNKQRTFSTKYVIAMFMCIDLTVICDSFTWFLDMKPEYLEILKIVWIVNFLLICLCVICYHYYLFACIERKKHANPFWKHIVIPVTIVMMILWILSLRNHSMFYADMNGHIMFGPYYFISPIVENVIIILDIIICIYDRKLLGATNVFIFMIFAVLPLVAVLLSFIFDLQILFYIALVIAVLFYYIFVYINQSHTLLKQQLQLESERLHVTASQVSPHFIYNILVAIKNIDGNPPDTKKALNDFAHYMRENLMQLSDSHLISFEQELKHIQKYSNLEKLRFDDVDFIYDIQSRNFMIPALSVQMFVENAVRHGVSMNKNGGTVCVRTYETDADNQIEITDNGMGFDVEKMLDEQNKHVGIKNASARIKMGTNGKVEIESTIGKGTRVRISIPKS